MADRYQNRPFPADDEYDRADQHARGESDPLAELARLIGQTDPMGAMGRANVQVPPRTSARDQYRPPAEDQYEPPPEDDGPPAGPPPWMQRANRQAVPQQDYPSAAHPVQRHATPLAAPEPDYAEPEPEYDEPLSYADAEREPDPARYDEALYGQPDSGGQHDPAYSDDAYAYQDGYDDGVEELAPKRRRGMATVVFVLLLAVVGTGAAFAYRTYVGSPRSSEPPIIRADAGPTKIVPAPADAAPKVPDRMAIGDGTEKIVSREESPVDVNAKSGPRVVLPSLSPNSSPPSATSTAPGVPPPATAANGTLPNNEPRKIKTLTVRGDQPDGAAQPVTPTAPVRTTAAPAPAAAPRSPPAAANANASANAPLSLVPQGGAPPAPEAEPRTRVAATNPTATPPAPAPAASGGYLVQVSSQRNEADAQASFRALQGKFPTVLGSRSPLIKRADLGDKGVYFRAMVGPFGSSDEAAQFCGSLKTAGGQCVVQRN
jgi:SPOR domain